MTIPLYSGTQLACLSCPLSLLWICSRIVLPSLDYASDCDASRAVWMDCDPQTHQMNDSQCTVDLTMYYHKFKLMMNMQFMGSHFVSGHLLRDSGIHDAP